MLVDLCNSLYLSVNNVRIFCEHCVFFSLDDAIDDAIELNPKRV